MTHGVNRDLDSTSSPCFLQCVELIYAVMTAAVMEYTTGSLKAQTTDCEKNCLRPQTEPTW